MKGERWPGLGVVKVEVWELLSLATLALRTGPTFQVDRNPVVRREKKRQFVAPAVHGVRERYRSHYDHAYRTGVMNLGKMIIMYLHFIIGDNLWFLAWAQSTAGAMAETCIGLFMLAIVSCD
jgi:hypothetical protein